MSQMRYEALRSIIRKSLQENYPAGAANDPRAPWNQEDPSVTQGRQVDTDLKKVGGDEDSDSLVTNGSQYYVISRENLDMDDELKTHMLDTYGEVPYTEEGPDEDGDPSREYDYEGATLNYHNILSAAQDAINHGGLNTPQEFENGEGFIYELTPEMAEQLWNLRSDLQHHPVVNPLIDWARLKNDHPEEF